MSELSSSAYHVHLMPIFWSHVNARKPKWAKAHDRLNVAEQMCGITPPTWGKLLLHPTQWRGLL